MCKGSGAMAAGRKGEDGEEERAEAGYFFLSRRFQASSHSVSVGLEVEIGDEALLHVGHVSAAVEDGDFFAAGRDLMLEHFQRGLIALGDQRGAFRAIEGGHERIDVGELFGQDALEFHGAIAVEQGHHDVDIVDCSGFGGLLRHAWRPSCA